MPSSTFLRRIGCLLLAAGSLAASRAATAPCDEKSVSAAAIRTREDVESFVQCAHEYVQARGTQEAHRAFHEDERWRSGQFYVFVGARALAGARTRGIVQPPDPSREGVEWGPVPDSFGPNALAEVNRIIDNFGRGWWYYEFTNPADGLPEPKSSYVIGIDWDGTPAYIGAGVYEPDLPGSCPSVAVNATLLAEEPTEEGLQAFVRCAAQEVESNGFFATATLANASRWRDGPIYLFGLNDDGSQLFTGGQPVPGGEVRLEWGSDPRATFAGRDVIPVALAFGETFSYYEAVNPATGTRQSKVAFLKRARAQGRPILLGAGYYLDSNQDAPPPTDGQGSSDGGAAGGSGMAGSDPCPVARQALAGIANRRVKYGFYTDFDPLSHAATQDAADPAFNLPLGYEPSLVAGVEAFAAGRLVFDRAGIGNPFSGIWLKAAEAAYDMVGGGITALASRTLDADGNEAIRFGTGHIGFRQSLLVRTESTVARHSDLTSAHRVGALRGTTGEARFLTLTGIVDADGRVRPGTRIELADGSVLTAGNPGSEQEVRIGPSVVAGAASTRVRLTPPTDDQPQVLYFESEAGQLDALVAREVDAVARGEIGNLIAARELPGLKVTALDNSSTEQAAFSYPATSEGDELRETMNKVIRCLTNDGAVGFQDWLASGGTVFTDRAGALR